MVKLGSVTYQAKLLEKPGNIKKDRKTLKKLDLIMWPNSIRLDSIT